MSTPDPLTRAFLERFDNSSKLVGGSERALYLLLNLSEEYLPPVDDPHWFHKAFRQTTVTPSAAIDMAIWHLLQASELAWVALEAVNRPAGKKNA